MLGQIADSSFLTCLERGVQIRSPDTLDIFCDVLLALLDFAFLPPSLVRQSSGRCFFFCNSALCDLRSVPYFSPQCIFCIYIFCRCCRSHESIFVDVFCTGSFRSLGLSISPVLSSVYYDMIIPVSDKMSLVG